MLTPCEIFYSQMIKSNKDFSEVSVFLEEEKKEEVKSIEYQVPVNYRKEADKARKHLEKKGTVNQMSFIQKKKEKFNKNKKSESY